MTVKIVTDSAADIPLDEAAKLGITVIPTYINYNRKTYKDGIDLDRDTFYNELMSDSANPTTAAPSPGDFAQAYRAASRDSNEIVSIHVTRKHSSIYDAALVGKSSLDTHSPRIEVIDSEGVTMWQGFVVLAAARAALSGSSIDHVVTVARQTINQLRGIGLLDTIAHIVRGGRISKAVSTLESLLHVKLMITLHDGELRPLGLVRTRQRGIDKLIQFVDSLGKISDLAICYTTTREEAVALADRVRSNISLATIRTVRLCPTLAVHAGPGVLIAAVQTTGDQ